MLFIFDRFATMKRSRNWFKPNLTWSYLSFPYLTFPYAPKPFFLRQTSLNFYLHTFTSKSSISFSNALSCFIRFNSFLQMVYFVWVFLNLLNSFVVCPDCKFSLLQSTKSRSGYVTEFSQGSNYHLRTFNRDQLELEQLSRHPQQQMYKVTTG
jgi:hypothetical protein